MVVLLLVLAFASVPATQHCPWCPHHPHACCHSGGRSYHTPPTVFAPHLRSEMMTLQGRSPIGIFVDVSASSSSILTTPSFQRWDTAPRHATMWCLNRINYLGMGARDLVTKRGVVQQTLMFVKHIRSDQDFSKLLCIGLEWFQLHAGIARPILQCPLLDIPYLEVVGWFRTLRKFLCFMIAEIHIDNLRVPHTLRENDHTLMESFLETQNFTCTDLYRLDLWRIYLRV